MSLSYLYFPLIGCLGTIIFGLICSAVVAYFDLDKEKKPVRKDCVSPCMLRLWKRFFPEQMARMISDEIPSQSKMNNNESKLSIVDGARNSISGEIEKL